MKLHSLPSTSSSQAKRLGRGYGSGKGGHTVGRGQKGQKSRGKIPAHFVGTSWVWFKRLPFLRGKSHFNVLHPKISLTLTALNTFKAGSVVSKDKLYQVGLITKTELNTATVKLVNSGKLEKKLIIEIPATKQAIKAIQKAGGAHRVQSS